MRARSPDPHDRRASPSRSCRGVGIALAGLLLAPAAFAQDAAEWLQRAAAAAQQLNYVGTIVYQHDGRMETSRLYHLHDAAGESEKLSNLDGPAREIVRNNDEVRCYYPDVKVVRVEPRSMHNAFPSLLPQQLATLTTYYVFRKAEATRIAGLDAQAYVFEPRDAARYGHKLWADISTGLLLKARLLNEKSEPVEQFAFSDIHIGAQLDRGVTRPPFETTPAGWQVHDSATRDIVPKDTGWTVGDVPAGFTKVVEGYRTLRGKPAQVVHIVYSDGLVAISVFVEPTPSTPQPVGASHQGGINVYSRPLDDYLVTVLGEAPAATVRQIAYSVAQRH